MTNASTESTIEARFSFFPTPWDPGVSRAVFELLVGPDRLMPATAWGNEGAEKLPTNPIEVIDLLTDRYEGHHQANRITLFTDTSFRLSSFELFRSEWDENSTLGQLLFWPKQLTLSAPLAAATTKDSLAALLRVAELTRAPLVELDFRADWADEPIAVVSRRELKRVVQGTVHAKAAAGPFRGLHRIPWRLILGSDFVETIGVESLTRLGPERAIDHGNGLWTLQTTADPVESCSEIGRRSEQEIITALGEEFFCNTDTNTLAQVPPAFPESVIPNDQLLVERYGIRLKPL